MSIRFFNNWKYKRNWSNLWHYQVVRDSFIPIKYINIGLFGFFVFIQVKIK